MSVTVLISGQLASRPEVKKTSDGRTMVTASIRARKGRENVETWRIVAYSSPARAALLRLNAGEFASVQGIGSVSAQRISGDVLLYTLFAEHVMALRDEGGDDAPSL